MQLAIVAAGFSPGEADRLRRAMAAWKRKGGLEPFQKQLIDGMRERGYDESFAQQIFKQILGFGEYGFPESHAASFALLVYTSAWLEALRAGGVLRGAHQQPADGILCAGAIGARCARPWRGGARRRCDAERLGLHPGAARGWPSRAAPGAAPGETFVARRRDAAAGRAGRAHLSTASRIWPSAPRSIGAILRPWPPRMHWRDLRGIGIARYGRSRAWSARCLCCRPQRRR